MSTSTHRVLAVVSGLALTAAGTLVSAPTDASPAPRASVQRLEATLRPSGDPDGSGEAHFTLNKARKKVCATVTWQNIEQPDSAHIHRTSDGGIVVDLSGAVTGGSKCRTGVSKRVIKKLLAHPERYYFNVHNPTYPAGAIQGTLTR
ncbi:CHRD domain-containing protein [Nocardioides aquiterrae]|uniref:CHRD domain-containing protein n=1 Tax=Nocardioides aquiterrae TaxID=203799 RepID=A0ABP4EWL3_9ACTN